MSKHSKHANTKAAYTSAERAASLGEYGTQKRVLSADNQRPWDVCCLTLSLVGSDPVCSPHGYLYDYEALLENMLQQKRDYKRQLKAWKEQQESDAARDRDEKTAKETEAAVKFMNGEDKLVSLEPTTKKTRVVSEANFDISNMATSRFAGVQSRVSEPKKGTVCPESRLPLKAKHLIHVKLHKLPNHSKPMDTSSGMFGCPVCNEMIVNSTLVVVFCDSGIALCGKCAEASKEGNKYRNPFTSTLTKVVPLKRGGTGYAGNADQPAVVKKEGSGFVFG